MYLCICVCVFACKTPGNIIFNIPVPSAFQKYSTCMVHMGSESIGRESAYQNMPIVNFALFKACEGIQLWQKIGNNFTQIWHKFCPVLTQVLHNILTNFDSGKASSGTNAGRVPLRKRLPPLAEKEGDSGQKWKKHEVLTSMWLTNMWCIWNFLYHLIFSW